MNNIQNLLAECSASGVTLGLKENKLVVQGRNASVKKLVKRIKRHKPAIMRQLVINAVAEMETDDIQYLSNIAFTDRYQKLMRAYHNNIIDTATRDEGLSFLLDLWRPEQTTDNDNADAGEDSGITKHACGQ